jgi:hypothetical protein
MSQAKETQFRYFRCVEGHVVPRFGTTSFIGVHRSYPGWEWNPEDVTAIPVEDCKRHLRSYNRALKDGSLIEVKKAEFDKVRAAEEAPKKKAGGSQKRAASKQED